MGGMGEFFAGLVGMIVGAGLLGGGVLLGVHLVKKWEGWQ